MAGRTGNHPKMENLDEDFNMVLLLGEKQM